jgi:hypothetical protein
MRNATAEQAPTILPLTRGTVRFAIAAIVVALAVAVVSTGFDSAPTVEQAGLSRANQAWADRLTGLAEAKSMAEIIQSRAADAARWIALGRHYQQQRANSAATERLTGLAEYLGANGLSRTQQAEADRLTGLAEHINGTR